MLSACNQVKETSVVTDQVETVAEIYEVHDDGRIYAFYDKKTFEEFMQIGETTFRLTQIGAGPNGETMVFGLTKKDKKKGVNTPAVKLYTGKLSQRKIFMQKWFGLNAFMYFVILQTIKRFLSLVTLIFSIRKLLQGRRVKQSFMC